MHTTCRIIKVREEERFKKVESLRKQPLKPQVENPYYLS